VIATEGSLTTYLASAVLPYQHRAGAMAGLRAELRHQITGRETVEVPDWGTLDVTGPVECADARGRVWFEYRATVETRRLG
jgi:hypothetical protein